MILFEKELSKKRFLISRNFVLCFSPPPINDPRIKQLFIVLWILKTLSVQRYEIYGFKNRTKLVLHNISNIFVIRLRIAKIASRVYFIHDSHDVKHASQLYSNYTAFFNLKRRKSICEITALKKTDGIVS